MAISSTYYLNAPSLGSATAVFTNASLTTLAANGFYSDGVISRQQVSGVLLPQQECVASPTTGSITVSFNSFDKSFTIQSTVPVPQSVFLSSASAVDGYPNNTCGAGTAVAGATLTGGILGLNVTGMVDSKPSTTFSGTWGTTTPYKFSSPLIGLDINGVSGSYANGDTVTISGIVYTIYIGKTCL